jgi:hypothetical protein
MRGIGRMLRQAVGDSLIARPDTVGLKKRIVENREKVQEIGNPILQEMLRKDGISQDRIDAMRGMLGRQLAAQEDSLYQERIKPAVAAGWKGRGGNWTYESPDSVDTPQGRRPRVRQQLTGVIPLSAEHRELETMGERMDEEANLPLDERIRRMRERMASRRNP